MNRRQFIGTTSVASAGLAFSWQSIAHGAETVADKTLAPVPPTRRANARTARSFHLCLAPDLVVGDPELVNTVRRALRYQMSIGGSRASWRP